MTYRPRRALIGLVLLVSARAASAQNETWTVESGIRIADTTSSSTIRLADNTYRTYYGGVRTSSSPDGLVWGGTSDVLRPTPGEQNRNPAIFQTGDGTYVLIFEKVVSNVARFYRATSPDGVTFTLSPSTPVMEPTASDNGFLSVPDVISVNATTVRMYFVAGGDLTDSATSSDGGRTWTREGRITVTGLSATNWIVDPDLIRTTSGGYRLFFATGPDGQAGLASKRIRSATSSDGRTFVLDSGNRLAPTGSGDDIVDPDVVLLPDGRYRMYYGYSTAGAQYQLLSAISSTPTSEVVPSTPANLAYTVSGTTVSVTWTESTGATSYDVEVGSRSGLADIGTYSTTTASLSGSAAAGTYYVRVRARNAAGTSAATAEIAITVGSCAALAAPAGLNYTVAGSTVVLVWAGASGATSYVLEAGSSAGATDLANVDTGSTSTAYTAPSVPRGTYYVRIRAKSSCATSAASNEVIVIVP